ncbi:voltage-dependent anion channel-domain-containing protein [Amylostereum chailletii]|nr:voltage-dependent anion channel-domain-containing protein [Amylostereum chailletii]
MSAPSNPSSGQAPSKPKTIKDGVRFVLLLSLFSSFPHLSLRGFTPAWFTITIGTGILSNVFTNFPYGRETSGVRFVAALFLFFNLLLFAVFTLISLLRLAVYPKQVSRTLNSPVHAVYFSTVPMAATTLINVTLNLVYNGYRYGGASFVYGIWVVWWINVAATLFCSYGLVHTMATVHESSFEQLTAVTTYPALPLCATASSGPLIAVALHPFNAEHALISIAVSAVLQIMGLSLLFMLTTVYFYRMIVHGYPEGTGGTGVVSMFLALSGFAQPGVTMVFMGQAFRDIFPYQNSASDLLSNPMISPVMYIFCLVVAFSLWTVATMWLILIGLAVQDVARKGMLPLKLPFWSLIFPMGIYTILTILLYRNFNSTFLRVYSAITGVCTVILWALAFFLTLRTIPNGGIFDTAHTASVNFGERKSRDSDTESLASTSTRRVSIAVSLFGDLPLAPDSPPAIETDKKGEEAV